MNWPRLAMGQAQQRWLLSIVLAVVVHLVLVFGVSFEKETPRSKATLPTLEILLSREVRPDEPVEEVDFLAQSNQQGEKVEKPEPPLTPMPEVIEETSPEPPLPQALPVPSTPPNQPPNPPLAAPEPVVKVVPPPPPAKVIQSVVTRKPARKARTKVETTDSSAASLMSRSLAMAQLSAEVEDGVSSYASLPRQKHISARTQEFKYAAYMEAWTKKVERVGNLNYPEQARKDNLTGSLILDVCLRPDGSIESIDFIQSSGHEVLDKGAENIVRMSAPFAAFPDAIRDEADLLHITRTWQFVRGNRLSGF